MEQSLANLVHPVFHYGLELHQRLERGENPSLELEQARLKSLLQSDAEARQTIEYGGETVSKSRSAVGAAMGSAVQRGGAGLAEADSSPFLGARYALVCWLDELFILHSSWESAWNERKLEVALYGTNDRAWRFWEQANQAETRPSGDALEVFYLCVMLGFRGEMIETPDKLSAWCKSIQGRVARVGQGWPHPPELEPPINVPPLRGENTFRRCLFWTCVLLLLLIPFASFLLVQQFSE